MFRRVALWVLGFAAGITGSIVVLRAFIGPLPLHISSPMNAESAFGFAIVLMLLARSTADEDNVKTQQLSDRQHLIFAGALILITAAAFWRTIHFYFLSDDFILLKYANLRPDIRSLFTTGGGDGFFRPVGYISLAAQFSVVILGSGILAWVCADGACHQCAARLCAFIADRGISNFCISDSNAVCGPWVPARSCCVDRLPL